MLRTLFILVLLPFGSISQIDQFYGSYFIGHFNDEMQFIVPYNCWTGNLDEVNITETGDSELPLELVFNSFHAEVLYGSITMAADSSYSLELINPDADTLEVRNYHLSRHSNGIVLLSEDNTDTVYFLVQVEYDNLYVFEQCPDEEENEEH